MIKAQLAGVLVEDADVKDLVESLLRIRRKGKQPVTLKLRKSALTAYSTFLLD
jgi:hypothetical protein